jgi:ketosteroid isomerase-like protein
MNDEQRSTSDEEQGKPGFMDRVKGAFSSGGEEDDGGGGGEETRERDAGRSGEEDRPAASGGGGGSRVEAVRGALKAFGGGQPDGFLEVLHEDVEWSAPSGDHFPGGGSHSGRDAVRRQHVEVVAERFDDFGFTPRMFLEGEDQHEHLVVVLGTYQGRGESGSLEAPAVQVWEFSEGDTAKKVHVYADSEHFRRATGADAPGEPPKPSAEESGDEESGDGESGAEERSSGERGGGSGGEPEERASEAQASADSAPEDRGDDSAAEGSGDEEHPTEGSQSREQTSRE